MLDAFHQKQTLKYNQGLFQIKLRSRPIESGRFLIRQLYNKLAVRSVLRKKSISWRLRQILFLCRTGPSVIGEFSGRQKESPPE